MEEHAGEGPSMLHWLRCSLALFVLALPAAAQERTVVVGAQPVVAHPSGERPVDDRAVEVHIVITRPLGAGPVSTRPEVQRPAAARVVPTIVVGSRPTTMRPLSVCVVRQSTVGCRPLPSRRP